MNRSDIVAKLDALNAEMDTAGMGVAAAIDGECVFTYYFGMQNREENIPVSSDTIFRAASVTKHMSAMTIMSLVDQGKLDLDTDIGTYLGYEVRNPFFPDVPITLRHLMTHTSTLIETGAYNRILAGEDPAWKLSEILPFDAPGFSEDSYLHCAPGEQYSYSSFGSGIMGAIGEKISGKRFADLARELLFEPIGIEASFDPRTLAHPENVAVSYELTDSSSETPESTERLAEQQEWLEKSLANKLKLMDLPVGESYRTAQGNVHIKPTEILEVQYVLMHDGVARNGVQVLTKASVEEMLKVQFEEGPGGPSAENLRQHTQSQGHEITIDPGIISGLNLHHDSTLVPGVELIGHFGRAYGVFSCTQFDLVSHKGVAVLTNGTRPDLDEQGHMKTVTAALREVFEGIDNL